MNNFSENNNPYKKAATAYRDTYVSNISGMEIVVELYKGMISNIENAKNAYTAGHLEKMCHLNDKTFKILIALQSNLDYEKGGDAAVFLNQFYNSIFASLTKVLREKNPEQAFNQILASMRPVYQRWQEFSAQQHKLSK